MTNEGAAALIRWVRAASREGLGMATGRQFILLRHPFSSCIQFARDASGCGVRMYLDQPELDWMCEADGVHIEQQELVFHFFDDTCQFYWPLAQSDLRAFDRMQNLWLCDQAGRTAAIVEVNKQATVSKGKSEPRAVPRLVLAKSMVG